ncbi:hypothetical protein [Spirulina sp. 06S082]|uniref:hypothetical protein n=1 Tax=Spirulina sp. 06S082 TaxID=3110248 RepID=UPI002B20144C|nr:hypothetical protein [Spirulina sp. 06S082]MEA5469255.1 hypothetical protein [Spirulina sp. 06S082]
MIGIWGCSILRSPRGCYPIDISPLAKDEDFGINPPKAGLNRVCIGRLAGSMEENSASLDCFFKPVNRLLPPLAKKLAVKLLFCCSSLYQKTS